MKTMAQRIADKVLVSEGGCWLWTGARAQNGYGSVRHGGRGRSAHKTAYEEMVGPVPEGRVVMHTCDRRVCVNPTHLRLGTYADNQQDMVQKGRQGPRRRKLEWGDVDAIRSMCASGLSQQSVAFAYGIAQATVSKVVRRESYDDTAAP